MHSNTLPPTQDILPTSIPLKTLYTLKKKSFLLIERNFPYRFNFTGILPVLGILHSIALHLQKILTENDQNNFNFF